MQGPQEEMVVRGPEGLMVMMDLMVSLVCLDRQETEVNLVKMGQQEFKDCLETKVLQEGRAPLVCKDTKVHQENKVIRYVSD